MGSSAKDHTRAVLWKKLAKSYRERHRWNSDVIERLQKEVEFGDKSRSLWKKFAKRSWQGWGYASKLHKEKHEELVRAAKHIDQLKSECNVWMEKIADVLMTKASIEGVKVKISFTYPRKKKADAG